MIVLHVAFVQLQVRDASLQAHLYKAAGALYSSLASCLSDPEQHQLLDMTLSVSPCVWVGSGFAFPAVAALQPDQAAAASQIDTAAAAAAGLTTTADTQHKGEAVPEEDGNSGSSLQQQQQQQLLLWVVPHELLQQHPAAADTLQAIGVRQQFGFAAYAIALAVLAERAAGHPLQPQQLDLSLSLAESAAHALLSGSSSIRQLQQPRAVAAASALQAAAAAAAGSSSVCAAGGADVLLLPDAAGVMAPPGELYFNDAAWLEAEGLRLAHQGLSQSTAEALGVRSMRWVVAMLEDAMLHVLNSVVTARSSRVLNVCTQLPVLLLVGVCLFAVV
jgi:hypothetical protein